MRQTSKIEHGLKNSYLRIKATLHAMVHFTVADIFQLNNSILKFFKTRNLIKMHKLMEKIIAVEIVENNSFSKIKIFYHFQSHNE